MKTITRLLIPSLWMILFTPAFQGFAQGPEYACICKNLTLLNDKEYKFDIYIYKDANSPVDLYLNNFQLSFKIANTLAILNGGTLTASYIEGSSELPAGYTPAKSNVMNLGSLKFVRVNGPPASSAGTFIPVSGLRIGSFKITNTNSFGKSPIDFIWNNSPPATTSIRAIYPWTSTEPGVSATGTAKVITNMSVHK